MDVAKQHVLGVVQDGAAIVGQHHLHLGPGFLDELLVVLDVVHAREAVLGIAEELAVFLLAEHVLPRIDALLVQAIQVDEMVAHLVGGIAEHQHDLLGAHGDAL